MCCKFSYYSYRNKKYIISGIYLLFTIFPFYTTLASFNLEFNPSLARIYRTSFHFSKRMHVDDGVAARAVSWSASKVRGSECDGRSRGDTGDDGERRRFSLIRTWPSAFEGISDVKAWGRRLLVTSPAQPASLHRHDIDQRHSWEKQDRNDGGKMGLPSEEGNITNSRRIAPRCY